MKCSGAYSAKSSSFSSSSARSSRSACRACSAADMVGPESSPPVACAKRALTVSAESVAVRPAAAAACAVSALRLSFERMMAHSGLALSQRQWAFQSTQLATGASHTQQQHLAQQSLHAATVGFDLG